MRHRGFLGRIFDAVESFVDRLTGAPEATYEEEAGPVFEPEQPEVYPYREEYGEPPAYFPEEPPSEPPVYEEPDEYERIWGPGEVPETSSAQEEFDYLADEYGLTGEDPDAYAQELLWGGWFDTSLTPDQRSEARAEFFEYMGWDQEDFDWDDWRDWYSATAG